MHNREIKTAEHLAHTDSTIQSIIVQLLTEKDRQILQREVTDPTVQQAEANLSCSQQQDPI